MARDCTEQVIYAAGWRMARLKFWGRQDDQVKINGYRIELNEVRDQLEFVSGAECLKSRQQAGRVCDTRNGQCRKDAGGGDGETAALHDSVGGSSFEHVSPHWKWKVSRA